jgi:hypothetical protein
MPVLTGIQFAGKLRRMRKDLPVVFGLGGYAGFGQGKSRYGTGELSDRTIGVNVKAGVIL